MWLKLPPVLVPSLSHYLLHNYPPSKYSRTPCQFQFLKAGKYWAWQITKVSRERDAMRKNCQEKGLRMKARSHPKTRMSRQKVSQKISTESSFNSLRQKHRLQIEKNSFHKRNPRQGPTPTATDISQPPRAATPAPKLHSAHRALSSILQKHPSSSDAGKSFKRAAVPAESGLAI